jgi:hypothetical protein
MLGIPGPVQRHIVQSASARRLYFVGLGGAPFYEPPWYVAGMELRYMSAT